MIQPDRSVAHGVQTANTLDEQWDQETKYSLGKNVPTPKSEFDGTLVLVHVDYLAVDRRLACISSLSQT